MRRRQIKNPCPICGRKTDSQGWCGSNDHDAGNPWGGINCFVIYPDKEPKNNQNIAEISNSSSEIIQQK